ncbi:hypothetical protein EDD11_000198 [Mortierella claussenii]|nr:hypothetical protein EDD11_000198 [Mortierella claussenii]
MFVSTDEVYGAVPFGEPDAKEDAPLAPSNPYSATKAAAECMVQAYHKSFKIPIIISRSNNIYGPFQYPEKIFPKFIMNLLSSDPHESGSGDSGGGGGPIYGDAPKTNGNSFLRVEEEKKNGRSKSRRGGGRGGGYCYIHGSGRHSRTYLYVTDVANALDVILHRGQVGQVYNIGGGHETSNLELAQDLIHRLKIPSDAPSHDDDGEHHHTSSCLPAGSTGIGIVGMKGRSRDYSGARQDEVDEHLKQCKGCAERIVFVEDRAFNDVRYAVDVSKLMGLGWAPQVPFEVGIGKTIAWFKEHGGTWWGDIHRALYPHSVRLTPEGSANTSAAPSPFPSSPSTPRMASSALSYSSSFDKAAQAT